MIIENITNCEWNRSLSEKMFNTERTWSVQQKGSQIALKKSLKTAVHLIQFKKAFLGCSNDRDVGESRPEMAQLATMLVVNAAFIAETRGQW